MLTCNKYYFSGFQQYLTCVYKKENAPLPLHSDLCDSFGTPEVDFSHWQPYNCACEGGSFFPGVGL